jgi:putative hydrolase of the HAD superfamily
MNTGFSPPPTQTAPESGPDFRPDFRHVRDWIFDLDNTLYCARNGVFAQIEARMTDFVVQLTAAERGEARRLQKDLYRQYGTTLKGLMVTRSIDPEPYLAFVHDIDLGGLTADMDLAQAIARLPGRRYIFTNGCRHHAGRILARLGMSHMFHDIWDIRTTGFVPKPDPAAYAQVVAGAGVRPDAAAMFDDIAHNLPPARALGMTTVWLKTAQDWSAQAQSGQIPLAGPEEIDHETGDLTGFLNSIRI